MAMPTRDIISFSQHDRDIFDSYLPNGQNTGPDFERPFVTLTFATSLDSQIALAPGIHTTLSGLRSKAMSHYIRSKHDAILIGVNTSISDDPGLNCRLEGVGGYGGMGLHGQPRPVIVDPKLRWKFCEHSKLFQLADQGRGRPPWIVTSAVEARENGNSVLGKLGGKYITVPISSSADNGAPRFAWLDILLALKNEGAHSIMVEGGAGVINALLDPENSNLVDSVILTIAPTWLGKGGVVVSPDRAPGLGPGVNTSSLRDIKWQPLDEDVVLCGRLCRPICKQ